MKKISFLTIFLAVALVCGAQKPVELRLNLQKGKTFTQNMDIKMNIKIEMMGMKIDTDVPFFTKISYKVLDIQNNNFVLECTYQEMKMSMDILGQKISFDSSDKKQDFDDNPIASFFSSFIGKSFKMTLDKYQNIVSIEGLDEIFASMVENGKHLDGQKEQMKNMIKEILGEEKIKENFSSSNIIFPKEPVKVGSTWETDNVKSLQGINMQVKNQFKIEKITAKKIEISSVSEYSMNLSVNENGQDVSVIMKDAKATGNYVINPKTGWTISSKTNADMAMVASTMGIEVPMQIIMEIIVK